MAGLLVHGHLLQARGGYDSAISSSITSSRFGVSVLFLKWNTLTKRALGGELLTWRFQKSFLRIFSAISSSASLSVLPRKSLNLLGITAATV